MDNPWPWAALVFSPWALLKLGDLLATLGRYRNQMADYPECRRSEVWRWARR